MFIRNVFEPVYNSFCIFDLFRFIFSDKVLFIFCNMCLLILLVSFFAGFSNLAVNRFKKFSWSLFNMMKLLPAPLISILLMNFASPVFLYFDVMAFYKRFQYSSLLRRYIFDVLSAVVKVLFDDPILFRSLASVY